MTSRGRTLSATALTRALRAQDARIQAEALVDAADLAARLPQLNLLSCDLSGFSAAAPPLNEPLSPR